MEMFEQRFNELSKKKPDWSSYIVFSTVVHQYNYSLSFIREAFDEFVKKGDYLRSEKEALILGLVKNTPQK